MSEHTTRDLGDGLVVRWSTAADQQQVADLFGHVFREKPEDPINALSQAYIRDEMSGRHPLIGPGDIAVAEDTRRGTIVSAASIQRQTWEYAGIAFNLARPEPVATHEDYRNRGLVRALFDLFHQRSEERGDLAQAVTGIGYFYRQFGYEYALDLGGSRTVFLTQIPKLKEGEPEPYRLRDAHADDLSHLIMLYERERTRHHDGRPLLVTTKIEPSYWRWMLDGQSVEAGEGLHPMIIERAEDGQVVGYVLRSRIRWGAERLGVGSIMTEPNVPMTAVAHAVLRGLKAVLPEVPLAPWAKGEPDRLVFFLGAAHPFYDAIGPSLIARSDPPYAWYVRVPDLPRFVRHIAPALERRLSGSSLSGYTGELRLDFYRSGMRMAFEKGKLTAAEPWRRAVWGDDRTGGFPPLVFLQLLFGRRSMAELRYAFPDVWASDESAMVLETLFPKQLSWTPNLD
jgi:GNAT superfamily N-acetyltransferase